MNRLLVAAMPNAPGVALLAQALRDAGSQVEMCWLCHPEWTSVGPFWERTLDSLDQDPGRLPIRWGWTGEARSLPRRWLREGYQLVLLGLPFRNPRSGARSETRQGLLRCLERLHRAAQPTRPVTRIALPGRDQGLEERPGAALLLTTNHLSQCRLDCLAPPTDLGRLAGLTILACNESEAGTEWVSRARALCLLLSSGNWDQRLRTALACLGASDWSLLDAQPLPDLRRPQDTMVVLRRAMVADLDGIAVNLRRHALDDALQVTGRPYGVGIYRDRGREQVLVARAWRGASAAPPLSRRLQSLLQQGSWLLPSPDHAYSPPRRRDELPALLDQVLEALEGPRAVLLPRRGGVRALWDGGEETVGQPNVPLELRLRRASPGDRSPDPGRPWSVRGDFGEPRHPLRPVLEALTRTPSEDQELEALLAGYREAMFLPTERGLVHTLKGRMQLGGAAADEAARRLAGRIHDFLAGSLPWRPGLTGSEEEGAEAERLERLAHGEGSREDLSWFLEYLGDGPRRVGTLPPVVREHLGELGRNRGVRVAWIDDPEAPPAVMWPPTLQQLLEIAFHNALEHGATEYLSIFCRRVPGGLAYATRDTGRGPDSRPEGWLERIRAARRGGLHRLADQVGRMAGEAWVRTAAGGVSFSGVPLPALKRRWLCLGTLDLPEALPDWLDLRPVRSVQSALDLAESRPAGWLDGFLLGPDAPDLDRHARGRAACWKWYELPRLRSVEQAGLAERPGCEIGFRLRELTTRARETLSGCASLSRNTT